MAEGGKKNGGARPGAGRKPIACRAELEALLAEGWPREQRVESVKRLAAAAVGGDFDAAKILLSYAYGKPTERKELSGSDGQPLKVIFEWVDAGIGGIGEGEGT